VPAAGAAAAGAGGVLAPPAVLLVAISDATVVGVDDVIDSIGASVDDGWAVVIVVVSVVDDCKVGAVFDFVLLVLFPGARPPEVVRLVFL
jgi:hypothetical protein